jgi:hypothetical protein
MRRTRVHDLALCAALLALLLWFQSLLPHSALEGPLRRQLQEHWTDSMVRVETVWTTAQDSELEVVISGPGELGHKFSSTASFAGCLLADSVPLRHVRMRLYNGGQAGQPAGIVEGTREKGLVCFNWSGSGLAGSYTVGRFEASLGCAELKRDVDLVLSRAHWQDLPQQNFLLYFEDDRERAVYSRRRQSNSDLGTQVSACLVGPHRGFVHASVMDLAP